MRALSVEQIAARLDDRFRLLTGGSRTALPRQQTLRGAVDWSYDLLSEPEQALLRRLAVFAGGFTLDAAEQMGRLDLLTSLVDKSLVQVEEGDDGERRYRLLETFRQYGQEKLTEHGELAEARDRHRDYFLALAEELAPTLTERPDSGAARPPRTGARQPARGARLVPGRAVSRWTSVSGRRREPGVSRDRARRAAGRRDLALLVAARPHRRGAALAGAGARRARHRRPALAGLVARDLALLGIANLAAYQGDYRASRRSS